MSKKIIEARVFIVPNTIVSVKTLEWLGNPEERYEKATKEMAAQLDYLGVILPSMETGPDALVQIWIHGSGSDNWQDHGCPEFIGPWSDERPDGFPSHVPVEWFDGKKEGDVITLDSNDESFEIHLTLCQLESRYRSCGPFEQCLAWLL